MTQHTEAPARVDEVRLQLVGSPRLVTADGQGRPLERTGLAQEAAAVLTAARQWTDAAAGGLPASLRHGFLYGNPANRALDDRLSRRR